MPYLPTRRECDNVPEYWSVEDCKHPVERECYL